MNKLLAEKTSKSCTMVPSRLARNFFTKPWAILWAKPIRIMLYRRSFNHLHGDCIETFRSCISNREEDSVDWISFIWPKTTCQFLRRLNPEGRHYPSWNRYASWEEVWDYAKCSLFCHPLFFKEEKHRHYRFSFPTKLPELISSGRPILSYGPKGNCDK